MCFVFFIVSFFWDFLCWGVTVVTLPLRFLFLSWALSLTEESSRGAVTDGVIDGDRVVVAVAVALPIFWWFGCWFFFVVRDVDVVLTVTSFVLPSWVAVLYHVARWMVRPATAMEKLHEFVVCCCFASTLKRPPIDHRPFLELRSTKRTTNGLSFYLWWMNDWMRVLRSVSSLTTKAVGVSITSSPSYRMVAGMLRELLRVRTQIQP